MKQLIKNGSGWIHHSRHKLATAAVGALLCMIGYHAIFGANGFLVFHQKKAESQRLELEKQALQQDNERREQEIRALKSDSQAIEKIVRERLRYTRKGEVVYTLPPAPTTPPKMK
jgi:cell division protein FtsB